MRQTQSMLVRTAPVLLVLAVALLASACAHHRNTGDDEPQLERRDTDSFYTINPQAETGLPELRIFNAYGGVHIVPSRDDALHVRVQYMEGFAAGAEELIGEGSLFQLWIVEDAEEIGISDAAMPVIYDEDNPISKEGYVRRMHRDLPRIHVTLALPANARVGVMGAAEALIENIDADVSVRVAGEVRVKGGTGVLRAECGTLDVRQSNVEIRGDVRGDIQLTGVNGDKLLSGGGNLNLVGGYGFVQIDVAGEVYMDSAIAPAPEAAEFIGGEDHPDLTPRGPVYPARPRDADRLGDRKTASSVQGRKLTVRLPVESRLQVKAEATSGGVHWGISETVRIDMEEKRHDSATLDIFDTSESIVEFTLNSPAQGELHLKAREGMKLLIESANE